MKGIPSMETNSFDPKSLSHSISLRPMGQALWGSIMTALTTKSSSFFSSPYILIGCVGSPSMRSIMGGMSCDFM